MCIGINFKPIMNSIKSLLGLLPLVLTIMIFPLSGEAQTITAPTGTNTSVKLIGQIYSEIGDHVKETQKTDDLELISQTITIKYAKKIDLNAKINNSDRKYLSKCLMYAVGQLLRCSFMEEGLNPDDPDVVPYYNLAMEELTKQVEKQLSTSITTKEALTAMETAFK